MTKKKSTSKPKAKAKNRAKARPSAATSEPVDTGVRQLVGKAVVVNLATEQKKCLARSATAGQDFSTEMKKAQERGLNAVSFRLVTRLTRMAERDPAKALVAYEDFIYYLECLGFEKMTSKPMFPAHEVRSGKKNSSKRNAPKQLDIEHDTKLAGNGGDLGVGDAELQEAAGAVH
jgi:hypothetical protein